MPDPTAPARPGSGTLLTLNAVVPILLEEIRRHGWLRFDQFMARALYCPASGYYEQKPDNPGPRGDYYTSVNVGPLFAELLAFQLADWLEPLARRAGPAAPICCVEAAAHDGRLARAVLEWFARHRPELAARLRYVILEPSARRRAWQQATLADWLRQVEWPGPPVDLSDPETALDWPLAPRSVRGIIFSNELLDAFPVRRLCWNARSRQWSEWGVTWDGNRFLWTLLPDSADQLREREALLHRCGIRPSPALLECLPDGFTVDVSPSAIEWWSRAAQSLQEGWLLTLDYGLTADECLQPHRARGTLRAYYQHHLADPLDRPGQQDLTAHVIFTAVEIAGEAAGLTTAFRESQERFFTRIAQRWAQRHQGQLPWDAARLRQFHTLTHPDHLGRAFQVLAQSRMPDPTNPA